MRFNTILCFLTKFSKHSASHCTCTTFLFSFLCICTALYPFVLIWGQGEDTEEAVSLTKPRTKTSTTSPEEASLTQKTPAKKKPKTVLIISFFDYLSILICSHIFSVTSSVKMNVF